MGFVNLFCGKFYNRVNEQIKILLSQFSWGRDKKY